MSISDADREDFIVFMRQAWKTQFRSDAVVYSIETDWLKPYHPVFYVGVTSNLERRQREHRDQGYDLLRECTPDEFYEALSERERLLERGPEYCSLMRKGIIAACGYQKNDIIFTVLDTIYADHYSEEVSSLSIMDMICRESGEIKTRFTHEVLERERRWVFKKLQEGCNLTNVERFCEQMIGALRARPYFDILLTPFSSPAWDPIIKAYLHDKPVLEKYQIH